MSQLFVDNIKNRTGGAVGFPTGVVVTGVATFNNQVSIAGTLSYEDVTNVDSTGIITAKSGVVVSGGDLKVGSAFTVGQAGVVTATQFVGDGSELTGVISGVELKSEGISWNCNHKHKLCRIQLSNCTSCWSFHCHASSWEVYDTWLYGGG